MDPDRSPPVPPARSAPPRRIPSPAHDRDRERERERERGPAPASSASSSARSHTTLPPIHQLHPGLAHASMQPPLQPAPASYMHGATYPLPSTSSLGVRQAADDSDQETTQGRQKQKRRRQALSCTECKRRKIKCDRANPCGPCVRRGEQTKCQWHIIEPMEKYVTRAEFDELKSRLHDLELLLRSAPASSPSAPISRRDSMSAMMPMTSGPPPEPIQGTAITPYSAYGTASYPLRPASPRSPVRGGEPPPPFHRAPPPSGTTRSPTMLYRPPSGPSAIPGGSGATARPATGATHPPPVSTSSAGTGGGASPRSPPKPTPLSPSMTTLRASGSTSGPSVRRSSISLAELTTPYDPKPLSPPKNYTAQTKALLGPRLRPSSRPTSPAHGDPSLHLHIPIVDTRQRVPV